MEFDWRAIAADHGPDLLIVVDEGWTVRHFSVAAGLRYGLHADDFIGRALPVELIHPEDLEYAVGAMAETERRLGDHVPAQFRVHATDGAWHLVEAAARSTIDAATGQRYIVLALREIERRDEPPSRRYALEQLVQRATTACAAAGPDEIEGVVLQSLGELGEYLHADVVMLGLVEQALGELRFEFEWSHDPDRSWCVQHPMVAFDDLLWDATKVPDRGFVFRGNLSASADRDGLAALVDFGVETLVDVVIASHDRPAAVISALFSNDGWHWDDSHASLVRMLGEILTVTVRRLVDYRQLRYQASHDSLTGLPNREHLMDRLRDATVATTLFFCDLDGFKDVNDQWGHDAGDSVLAEVGRRIAAAVRDDDFVARVGGDEFVVLSQVTGERDHIATRIENAVNSMTHVGSVPVSISVSVGWAMRLPGEPIEPVLHRADASMYRTKNVRRARNHRPRRGDALPTSR